MEAEEGGQENVSPPPQPSDDPILQGGQAMAMEVEAVTSQVPSITIDEAELARFRQLLLAETSGWSLVDLERLLSDLSRRIHAERHQCDRTVLLEVC